MKFRSNRQRGASRPTDSYNQPTVRFLPLGGMGNVTRNLYVYEYFGAQNNQSSDILLVDCGIGFPEEEMLGVDLVLPDIAYLEDRKDRVRGLVVTHGHMDHIGAIPFILPQLPVPVYASRLSSGFIKADLEDREVKGADLIREVNSDSVLHLGAFEVSFIRLSHSVPDAFGVAIKTPVGTIFHTGDYKFDWTPVLSNQAPEVGRLAQFGRQGIHLLVTDCLRVENPGYTLSEREISNTFDQAMRGAKGRVLITTFSSNISRIQQAIDVSRKYNRKVCFLGRSMENYSKVARELGYLNVGKNCLVKVNRLKEFRPNQQTLIVAGSQGQRYSALSRIVRGDHRWVKIDKADTVIFSSDSIPGNEASVSDLIDRLVLAGAQVVYSATTSALHVSGHASREELKLMVALTKPKHLIPISGSFRHMELMAELAEDMGIPRTNIFVLQNGESLDITAGRMKRGRKFKFEDVLIDGLSVGEVGELVLEDRKVLSDDGLILVVALVNDKERKLEKVDIVTRGFVYESGDKSDQLRKGLQRVVRRTLEERKGQWHDKKSIDRALAKALRNYVFKKIQLRPMVLPIVMGRE